MTEAVLYRALSFKFCPCATWNNGGEVHNLYCSPPPGSNQDLWGGFMSGRTFVDYLYIQSILKSSKYMCVTCTCHENLLEIQHALDSTSKKDVQNMAAPWWLSHLQPARQSGPAMPACDPPAFQSSFYKEKPTRSEWCKWTSIHWTYRYMTVLVSQHRFHSLQTPTLLFLHLLLRPTAVQNSTTSFKQ